MLVDLESFLRGAPIYEGEKRWAAEILRAAGFEDLTDFENVETEKIVACRAAAGQSGRLSS